MTQPEYIAALLSIVVGLGLTDLAQSLRELVRPRRRVDWHWLPLLWAVTTFLVSIQLWWNAFSFLKEATSEFFLPFLAAFLFLYLTCAFALPDPEWQKPQATPDAGGPSNSSSVPLDLEMFYFSDAHRRWYFGMFIAFLVTSQIGGQSVRVLEKYGANLEELLINAAFAGLLGTLALTDRWWVHAPISVLCFLGIGWATLTAIL
jgi:hypothetical protein